LITKPAISLGQAVLIMVMDAFGYDATLAKGAQSYRAETGILLGWALVTGALLILSFLALHFYPLAGKEWDGIKKALGAKHREEERKFLEAQGIKFSE
jgi:Na+/melibiose symporter-like transporter